MRGHVRDHVRRHVRGYVSGRVRGHVRDHVRRHVRRLKSCDFCVKGICSDVAYQSIFHCVTWCHVMQHLFF